MIKLLFDLIVARVLLLILPPLLLGIVWSFRPLSAQPPMDPTRSKPGDLIPTPFLLETKDGKPVAAEWGRLVVPENRSQPEGNLIELPFVRFKTTATEKRPPIFSLAGGPGDETLGNLTDVLLFVPTFQALGDLIILEPRGVGYARPRLDCPGSYHLPLDKPLNYDTLVKVAREYMVNCAEFWKGQEVDLSGYNAREMAADINALRQALGYDKIILFGGSFGSHHGLAVLRYYDEYIERAVLSGVEGPNHTLKLPSTVQRHLEKLDAIAKTDPQLRRHIPGFLDLVATVLSRLEKEPVTVEVKDPETGKSVAVTVGALDLQAATANGMRSVPFLQALPARYHAMAQGNFSWLAERALENRRNRRGRLMPALVDCASGATKERCVKIEREAEQTLLGGIINGTLFDYCDDLGGAYLNDEFRGDLYSEVPVLLVSGSLDTRTPMSNAEEVLKGLVNGQHLILENVSHNFGDLGEEQLQQYLHAVIQFLMGKPLPTTRIVNRFQFDPIAP